MIIVEGPDGSGKSTLIYRLGLPIPHYIGGGPEKYPGEINERLQEFQYHAWTAIYDRHPLISHYIYGNTTPIQREYYRLMRLRDPLFIYCTPQGLDKQVVKSTDTAELQDYIKNNYASICDRYEVWALTSGAHRYDQSNYEEIEVLCKRYLTRRGLSWPALSPLQQRQVCGSSTPSPSTSTPTRGKRLFDRLLGR